MIRVTLKGLLANRLGSRSTGLAVMLGVAFMAGTMVYSDTLAKGFDDLLATNFEHTDAVVRAPERFDTQFGDQRDPVPEALVGDIAAVEGVAAVEGHVQGYAQLGGREGKAIDHASGRRPSASAGRRFKLNPMTIVEGRPPADDDEVVIDARSADQAAVGRRRPDHGPEPRQATSVHGRRHRPLGERRQPLGATISGFTMPVAQELLGERGMVNQIAVVAEDGVSQSELRDRLLPLATDAGLEVRTGEEMIAEGQADMKESLAFFDTFLLVFALIALFVGSFIIFNTFSIVVAQRTREVALLRAVGATKRQVLTGVVVESVVLAAVASVLGLFAASRSRNGLRALLGSVGLDMPGVGTQIGLGSMLAAFAVGFAVTVVAAVWPARRAAAVPPLAAMRDVEVEVSEHSVRRAAIGAALVVTGAARCRSGCSRPSMSDAVRRRRRRRRVHRCRSAGTGHRGPWSGSSPGRCRGCGG